MRRSDSRERRRAPIRDEAINVFMSLPDDGPEPRLELTFNFGVDSYEIGTGYGHIAITTDDLDGTLARSPRRASSPSARRTRSARAVAAVLRARPGRLPDRDHRAERIELT